MTPKEKAKELVYKIREDLFEQRFVKITLEDAVVCALIAVEEILNEYQSMSDLESVLVINNKLTFIVHQLQYWMEVKQEIEIL